MLKKNQALKIVGTTATTALCAMLIVSLGFAGCATAGPDDFDAEEQSYVYTSPTALSDTAASLDDLVQGGEPIRRLRSVEKLIYSAASLSVMRTRALLLLEGMSPPTGPITLLAWHHYGIPMNAEERAYVNRFLEVLGPVYGETAAQFSQCSVRGRHHVDVMRCVLADFDVTAPLGRHADGAHEQIAFTTIVIIVLVVASVGSAFWNARQREIDRARAEQAERERERAEQEWRDRMREQQEALLRQQQELAKLQALANIEGELQTQTIEDLQQQVEDLNRQLDELRNQGPSTDSGTGADAGV